MRIFISGKMEKDFNKARKVLTQQGLKPVGRFNLDQRNRKKLIKTCRGIYILPQGDYWEEEFARENNLEIFFECN